MLNYDDLNDNQKRILREKLNISRIYPYYLEDHNILLMKKEELFQYIYVCDLKKVKDAISLLTRIMETKIKEDDKDKSFMQVLIENNEKVIKIDNNIFAYKE